MIGDVHAENAVCHDGKRHGRRHHSYKGYSAVREPHVQFIRLRLTVYRAANKRILGIGHVLVIHDAGLGAQESIEPPIGRFRGVHPSDFTTTSVGAGIGQKSETIERLGPTYWPGIGSLAEQPGDRNLKDPCDRLYLEVSKVTLTVFNTSDRRPIHRQTPDREFGGQVRLGEERPRTESGLADMSA